MVIRRYRFLQYGNFEHNVSKLGDEAVGVHVRRRQSYLDACIRIDRFLSHSAREAAQG